MAITKLRPTFTFDQERLDALKAIAPEAFADGKINWETLKEALGEHLEDEEQETEHFGLTWPGKRAARRLASQPSAGTLRSAPGEGLDEETTHHVFIEGDNLEVLKLLQKSYAGRVKMIYIDPPYNTGNDFVYKDDYRQPLEEYLRATGQADEAGRVLTTNTKSGGRFHSNWLNVMYPRLRLARNLLSSDGIIFVSIDDTEVHNLRMLMNEMFGEENFISEIVWKNKYGPGAQTKGVASLHEYILCYSKGTIESIESMLSEEETKQYKLRDEKFAVRGGYTTQPLATRSKDDRPNLVYPIEYKGKTIWPNKQWIWARERMEQALKNNEVVISEKSGEFSVRFKQYLRDEHGRVRRGKPLSLLNGPFNQEGTKEMARLLGREVFDFPKPVPLIKRLCSFIVNGVDGEEDIILDFFAGSCTTAQAILELNREDGGNRRFIMVQLPEPTPADSAARHAGYATIAEIGKERIRRVIQRMQSEQQARLIPDRETPEDLGFRVFKLERSHFKAWQDYAGDDVAQLETLFDHFESPLAEGWQPGDLLVEVMLMQGFPLDSAATPLAGCRHNRVLRVTSDLVTHELYVCLDEHLHPATVEVLALRPEDVFVCLDSALDEETKLRLQDGRNVMVI